MEEVWRAVISPSLAEQYPTSVGRITVFNNYGLSNMNLGDLLARPFNKDRPRRGTSSGTSVLPPPPDALGSLTVSPSLCKKRAQHINEKQRISCSFQGQKTGLHKRIGT
ncbi:hypothetical protein SLA2020_473970 [Shorea laevis]